jgi:hypothetical protein
MSVHQDVKPRPESPKTTGNNSASSRTTGKHWCIAAVREEIKPCPAFLVISEILHPNDHRKPLNRRHETHAPHLNKISAPETARRV